MIKISKHISLLEGSRCGYPHSNSLWITDDINCLIDSGPSENDLNLLKTRNVDLIINSHGHCDHVLYNREFPNTKIVMHAADHRMVQSAEGLLDEYLFTTFYKHPEEYSQILEELFFRPSRIDGEIRDKQLISLGKTNVEVLHLPGHSAGHCGFIFPEQGFIYTSDMYLSKIGPHYGTKRASLPDMLNSIKILIDMKPDYIICSHDDAIIKGDVIKRLIKFRDIIYARQKHIVELIYRGRHRIEDIASAAPIFRQFLNVNPMYIVWEKGMILQHLRYLMVHDYVIEDGGLYYLHPRTRISSI